MIKYDNEYYLDVIKKYNYNLTMNIDKSLENLPIKELQKNWLCIYNYENLKKSLEDNKKTLFTMGIGINYVPHMGTLSQILKAIYLQQRGFAVQIVLGDLDVYNARSKSMSEITEMVKQYKEFIIKLGFNEQKGIIRNQYDHDEIIKTAYMLSTCVRDKDFYEVEEDINELYKTERVYEGMDFNVKQSIMLMFADFIYPGYKNDYKTVIVMSGIDEHTYVSKANEIAKRMNIDVNICGLFSKMLRGLEDYPKMSKSIKQSVINVLTTREQLSNIFESDHYQYPDDSLIYQLMQYVSEYSFTELDKIRKDCENKNDNWENEKQKYINYLVNLFHFWK